MQGVFESEIFTNLILSRYFSLFQLSRPSQLSRNFSESGKNRSFCLKTVSKLWYNQCKRAFFILFHRLCALQHQELLRIKNPLCVTLTRYGFCMFHNRWESSEFTLCKTCQNKVCFDSMQHNVCKSCLPMHQCSICKKLSSRGKLCLCREFVCEDTHCSKEHSVLSCEGIDCINKRCSRQLSCSRNCMQASTQICGQCSESRFCVAICRGCDRLGTRTYFCGEHKNLDKIKCSVCEERCKNCSSLQCEICLARRCFKSNKTCTMLEVGDLLVCLKCAENFVSSKKEEQCSKRKSLRKKLKVFK
jgi:hypothetical protein